MKQEIVEKFINKMFPDAKIEIISYELMPRFDFNDKNEFVEIESAIFMDLKCSGIDETYLVSKYINKFTGYECSITIL